MLLRLVLDILFKGRLISLYVLILKLVSPWKAIRKDLMSFINICVYVKKNGKIMIQKD